VWETALPRVLFYQIEWNVPAALNPSRPPIAPMPGPLSVWLAASACAQAHVLPSFLRWTEPVTHTVGSNALERSLSVNSYCRVHTLQKVGLSIP
jgi:hypothetical protein